MILARVPKDRIRDGNAYEYLKEMCDGSPVWTEAISQRGAVFSFPGGCNRADVAYNAPLKRYFMTLRSRAKNGGRNHFGIYDAPEPWGPWTVVYYSQTWEGKKLSEGNGGWGESQHIPGKWISEDGKEFFLIFAGDDSFAVRKATLTIVE